MALQIENFSEVVRSYIVRELESRANDLVQNALTDIEKKLREKLAESVLAIVETSYDIERAGSVLTIRVRLGQKG